MKLGTTMLSAFAVLLAVALPSWAQVKALPKQTVTIAGTIETIDQNKRAMNIKTADGKFVAVNVPPSVKRFSELKVGEQKDQKARTRLATRHSRPANRLAQRLPCSLVNENTSTHLGLGQRHVRRRCRRSGRCRGSGAQLR